MSGWRHLRRPALVLVTAILVIISITMWALTGDHLPLITLPFVVVGALLVAKGTGSRIGWVLSSAGVLAGTGSTSTGLATLAIGSGRTPSAPLVALAWYGEWYWVPMLFLMLVALPLRLPSGQLRSSLARALSRVGAVTGVAWTAAAMFQRDLLTEEVAQPLRNPFGLLPYGDLDYTAAVSWLIVNVVALGAGAVAMLLRRLARADGVERQQLKIITFGVAVTVGGFLGNIALEVFIAGSLPPWLQTVVMAVAPCTILVAVTRYRLYEIDHVISRTVAYTLVTAVLATIYVVIAVVPSAVFKLDSDLFVAAATLAAAAVFVPVRRRVQATVDRRFNRARYDAGKVIERFGTRLREDLDVANLSDDLGRVVAATVQPTHVSLWLAEPGARP